MDEQIHISKLEAARRQLNAAIRLLFDGADPIVVHTLVGAASVIISHLVDKHHPDESWDKFAQEANGLTPKEYFNAMRFVQNFLKHARDDPDDTLSYDPKDTESLAFWAVLNLGNFGKLSLEASTLQFWYLACHDTQSEPTVEPYCTAYEIFGDLRNEPRDRRLASGRRVLSRAETLLAG